MTDPVSYDWTAEELDIINNELSVKKYLEFKDHPAKMRQYLDRILTHRREKESADLDERYARIVRKSKGRLSDKVMRELAMADHKLNFTHVKGN